MQNKILLSAVNAKYIHSNLAIRYLKKYCEAQIEGIGIAEFSINDNINNILKQLYNSGADIFGFSCYIWNINLVRNLCSSLKKAKPEAVIILGGPEVSYDSASLLKDNPFIDYIVIGEGEATLLDLLSCITDGKRKLSGIPGIAYKEGAQVVITQDRPLISCLDEIPFPYESFDEFENKIVYYETSRGCPFNCQYCLSSTIHGGVRYLSMDRLRHDVKSFIKAGIRQVKLVDRTFNCDIERSIEIMQYIMDLNSATNFHFEIAADLINERFLQVVEKAPEGMFQFEIGVQSTNPKTLSEIERKMDFDKVGLNVSKLVAFKNAHIHLDLIAGLPYEDMESFKKSFNDVYAFKPDMLQLGFLKLLKGSGIRENFAEYGMEHHDFPPYEVISTKWLSYGELLVLKDIENVLEQYCNSGKFKHTLDFLLMSLSSPFDFYHRLSDYWNSKGHFNSSKSVNELYTIFKHFVADQYQGVLNPEGSSLLNENLKLDWLLYSRSGSMPEAIDRYDHSLLKDKLQEYLKESIINMKGFEEYKNMPMREVLKHVGYEVFTSNIFDITPSREEAAMFYPLKQKPNSKCPFFVIIPLKEIIHKG